MNGYMLSFCASFVEFRKGKYNGPLAAGGMYSMLKDALPPMMIWRPSGRS